MYIQKRTYSTQSCIIDFNDEGLLGKVTVSGGSLVIAGVSQEGVMMFNILFRNMTKGPPYIIRYLSSVNMYLCFPFYIRV